MRWLKWIIPLLVLPAAMVGCGDTLTAEDPGNGGGGVVVPAVASITLVASPSSIGTTSAAKSTVTAYVKDSANRAMADQAVSFTSSSGVLMVTQATTDSAGVATATVSPGADASNRTVSVTATAGSQSATIGVTMSGTSISISGANTAALGIATNLTITLRDSSGAAVANTALTVSSAENNTLSPATVNTNTNGQATVQFTALSGGVHTVTATALGATASLSISVSTDVFTVTMDPELAINTCMPVTVTWTSSGAPVSNTVNFSATRGTLYSDVACTIAGFQVITSAATGKGTMYIRSPNTGPVAVTAATATASPLVAETTGLFIANTPATLDFQASRSTLSLNDSVDITATVKDANGNLVKGQTIVFSIVTDQSGGSINPPYATTDSLGRATTIYTSTIQPSALDGVEITATVQSAPSITDSVKLTVGGTGTSIKIGMATDIADDPLGTIYVYAGSVIVTDNAGNPVAGKAVTLQLDAESFDKGSRVLGTATSSTTGTSTYAVFASTGQLSCANEDIDRDGELDLTDNDLNLNGSLEPGKPAGVDTSVVTGADGTASFLVTYPKDYAEWLQVRLIASVLVSGTESSNAIRFRLPMSQDDRTSPPGTTSPYGVGLCNQNF